MTNITILTYGSRGDVQPYIALGRGLRAAGHEVRIAAPQPFADSVTENDLAFAPLGGDPGELVRGLVEEAGSNPFRIVPVMMRYALPLGQEVFQGVEDACTDADLIIHSFLMTPPGHSIARRRGVPDVSALLYPIFTPTGEFPAMLAPPLPLGKLYNRVTHHLLTSAFWAGNKLGYLWLRRQDRTLPPLGRWMSHHQTPVLYGISRHVVPPPVDWPDHARITGYWFMGAVDYDPPPDLLNFLAAGPPPVYIGFGSTIEQEMAELGQIAIEALQRTEQRGIMLGGWGGLTGDNLPDTIYPIDRVPHGWLFPRTAAAVHHGGAGTTAASLRAGIPTIVTPFASDQPYWGAKVHELGVGPAPIPRKDITVDKLAHAIEQAITDSQMRERAAVLGAAIRQEDGIAEAVQFIEEKLS